MIEIQELISNYMANHNSRPDTPLISKEDLRKARAYAKHFMVGYVQPAKFRGEMYYGLRVVVADVPAAVVAHTGCNI